MGIEEKFDEIENFVDTASKEYKLETDLSNNIVD